MRDGNSWNNYRRQHNSMRIRSPYAQRVRRASEFRRDRKRNRGWTVVALSVLVFLFALHHLMTSPNWYLLQRVRIVGANQLDHHQVLRALNLHVGSDNLQELPQDEIAQTLKENLVYVLDAEVTKELMEGVLTIHIVERTPSVLLVYRDSSDETIYRLTDLEGAVLNMVNAPESYLGKLTTIEISSEEAPEPGTRLTSKAALQGLEVIRLVRNRAPHLEEEILRVFPCDASKIRLELKEHAEAWLAEARIEDGLLNLSALMKNTDVDLRSVAYIDARFQGMVYCGG